MLLDKVCEHLNLLEKDYFGITHRDVENQKVKVKVVHTVLNTLIIVTVGMWAPLETSVLLVYSVQVSQGLILLVCCRIG